MNPESLFRIVAKMGGMKYFPADVDARLGIAEDMASMCADLEQAEWLSRRMRALFPAGWPGTGEMRAILCSKFRPKDGVECYSTVFIDGIPSEDPARNGLLSPPAPLRQLAGDIAEVSDSPSFQRTVLALAAAKAMERNPVKVPEIQVNRVTPANAVTQADIEREVQALRDKRARAELDGVA